MKICIKVRDDGEYIYSNVEVDEGPIAGTLRVKSITDPKRIVAMFAPGFWQVLEIIDHETGEDNGEEEMNFEDFRDKVFGLGKEGKSEGE